MTDLEVRQRLRFETLAAFVRDMASYNPYEINLEEMREQIEMARYLKEDIIDKE